MRSRVFRNGRVLAVLLTPLILVFALACTKEVPVEVEVEKIVERTVEVPVEVEKIVERIVEVEVEKIVERTVEVEVEVEKVVVVTPTPEPRRLAKVARLNAGTEPPTIDPALATDSVSITMIENLFVGLTNINPLTSEVEPELATTWDVSEDGTVYTFHLRQDARWSDGAPVTAHDVEYGVLRTLNPETGSGFSFIIASIIKNAGAYNFGEISDPEMVGVRALDDYTLEVILEHPAGYFPAIAANWVMFPQPQWAIETHGDQWTEPENIVTNGAYRLLIWAHGSSLVMEKNADYFAADQISIQTIDFTMVEELPTAMAMYEAGALDTTIAPVEDIDRIKADPVLSAEFSITPSLATYFYGFTVDKPPFDDVLVRKAFTAAVDRQELIDFVLKSGQTPALTFTAPGNLGAVDAVKEGIGIPFDPEQARAWLAEAGYPGGEGLPEVNLVFNSGAEHQQIGEAIAAMWKEHLGVDVNLSSQEFGVYLGTLSTDPPHMYRLSYGSDYPDADNWLKGVFHSAAPINFGHFNSPEFDALVEQAAAEQDPSMRIELYKQAEQILTEDVVAILPIFHQTNVFVTKPYLLRTFPPFGGEQIQTWKAFIP